MKNLADNTTKQSKVRVFYPIQVLETTLPETGEVSLPM